MSTPIVFTEHEMAAMQKDPAVLRALADYHQVQLTMADASDWGECVPFHQKREAELLAEAARIESEY